METLKAEFKDFTGRGSSTGSRSSRVLGRSFSKVKTNQETIIHDSLLFKKFTVSIHLPVKSKSIVIKQVKRDIIYII